MGRSIPAALRHESEIDARWHLLAHKSLLSILLPILMGRSVESGSITLDLPVVIGSCRTIYNARH